MRALFASPTYGSVDAGCVSAIRLAVMSAGKHGTDWIGDISPDRLGYSDARNFVMEHLAKEPDLADGIMWVDSDMRPKSDSIHRLLSTAEKNGFDFFSGVYHQRRGGYRPCFFGWDDKAQGFRLNLIYQPDEIRAVAGCGFGFCWTSTKLILGIQKLPDFDPDHGGWFPDKRHGEISEDLGFCLLAKKAGFTLYVDTGIQVGHMGETEVITRETYLKAISGPSGTPKEVEAR